MVGARTVTEWRVSWERGPDEHGIIFRKSARFGSLKAALRRVMLMGPEPWLAFGKLPDAWHCCPGTRFDECACGGLTVRQASDKRRETLPPLRGEPVITKRTVTRGPWEGA